jgi:hypothetical protein
MALQRVRHSAEQMADSLESLRIKRCREADWAGGRSPVLGLYIVFKILGTVLGGHHGVFRQARSGMWSTV